MDTTELQFAIYLFTNVEQQLKLASAFPFTPLHRPCCFCCQDGPLLGPRWAITISKLARRLPELVSCSELPKQKSRIQQSWINNKQKMLDYPTRETSAQCYERCKFALQTHKMWLVKLVGKLSCTCLFFQRSADNLWRDTAPCPVGKLLQRTSAAPSASFAGYAPYPTPSAHALHLVQLWRRKTHWALEPESTLIQRFNSTPTPIKQTLFEANEKSRTKLTSLGKASNDSSHILQGNSLCVSDQYVCC